MRGQAFPYSRQTETRLRVLRAVDRPIDKLTCTQICEKAHISRQLFYRYFDSKFDIPIWYSTECDRVSISEIGRSLTWMGGLTDFFALLYREKDSLCWFSSNKESQASRHWADRRRTDVFRETIEDHGIEIDDDLAFQIDVYSNCFNKIFAIWMEEGMDREPEHIARLAYEFVPDSLRKAVCPASSS